MVRASLATILSAREGIDRTALILVGHNPGADDFGHSRLYAADYDRRYRPLGAQPRFPVGTE